MMLIKHAWLKVKTIRNWQFPWEMSKSKGDVSEAHDFFKITFTLKKNWETQKR